MLHITGKKIQCSSYVTSSMLPRSPHLSHKHRLNNGLPSPFFSSPPVLQQLVEFQRNRTNSSPHGPPYGLPVIPTYQWDSTSNNPPGPRGPPSAKGRKRRFDDYDQNDFKRQCFSPPRPYNRPVPHTSPLSLPTPSNPKRQLDHGSPQASPRLVRTQPSLFETAEELDLISLRSSAKDKLSQQIVDLYELWQQQEHDLERKEQCRSQLQLDIQTLFPFSRIYLVGSSLNGFGSRSSDADLCLVFQDSSVNQRKDALNILSLIHKLCYSLPYIDKPQLIHAKVPILKFTDRMSGVEFDLNVNNVIGIRNTFLLRSYAYIEKRVRPIVLAIKRWAGYYKINDASRGTLSSYTLVLMVLHYLQTLPQPVIPCLQMDYPECFHPSLDIQQLPSGSSNIPRFISKNQASLGELFLGFLKYYATYFKWDKYIISVRHAKALPKNGNADWKKYICVEEPFEGTNTARAVHEKCKFEAIKNQFHASWQVLQHRKDLNSVLPLRQPKHNR